MYNPNFLDFLIRSIIIILINFISFVNVICFVSLNQKKVLTLNYILDLPLIKLISSKALCKEDILKNWK